MICLVYIVYFSFFSTVAAYMANKVVYITRISEIAGGQMCLLYALSAWGGYISIDKVGRLNKILRKANYSMDSLLLC